MIACPSRSEWEAWLAVLPSAARYCGSGSGLGDDPARRAPPHYDPTLPRDTVMSDLPHLSGRAQ